MFFKLNQILYSNIAQSVGAADLISMDQAVDFQHFEMSRHLNFVMNIPLDLSVDWRFALEVLGAIVSRCNKWNNCNLQKKSLG